MTDKEKKIIRRFAKGDKDLRSQALEIHRRNLQDLNSDEQRFMSEIDSPCPDFLMRRYYREKLF
jgi:hypothetical protein